MDAGELPQLQALLLADAVDQGERGKKTLKGIFSFFLLPSLPASASFNVFLKWSGHEKGEYKQKIVIEDPNQKKVVELESPCIIPEEGGSQEVVLFLDNFLFREYGKYKISVFLNDQEINSVFMTVTKPIAQKEEV